MRSIVASALVALTLCFSGLVGCHGGYTVHPGAVNTVDSQVYDALLVASTTIDAARPTIAPMASTSPMRLAFATLIDAYNVARTSWLTYRGAVTVKDQTATQYLDRLNSDLTQLSAALAAFKGAKP